MKRLAASLWILAATAAVVGAALERDAAVAVDGLVVTPLRPWAAVAEPVPVEPLGPAWVLGDEAFGRAGYAALPRAGEAVRLDRDAGFGAVAEAAAVPDGVSVTASYPAAGGDAPVRAVAGVLALPTGLTALTAARLPAFGPAGLTDSTGDGLPVFGPLREGLGVAEVRLAYARLAGMAAVATDPLIVPIHLWNAGPLGDLRRQANAAAARGDKAAFQELAVRYWALFNAAVERRRVLGEKSGRRKGEP